MNLNESESSRRLCKVVPNVSASCGNQPMIVQCSILVHADGTWRLFVHGKEAICTSNPHLSGLPRLQLSCGIWLLSLIH